MKEEDIWAIGISGLGNSFHDNSVCLVRNGKIVFAASEERYTRLKHDSSFPKRAFNAALKFAGINKGDIDYYASGWPPLLPLKALLGLSKVDVVRSGINYLAAANGEGLVMVMKTFRSGIKKVSNSVPISKHNFIDHYLAHASSAYRTSGLEPCLTVVWDGFGTKDNGSLAAGGIFLCKKGKIEEVETHPLEASLGLFYQSVTSALGFAPAEGEGKTMGLAVYGNPRRFISSLTKFAPRFDGSKWIASRYWPDTLASTDLKYKAVFNSTYMGRELAKMIKKSSEDVAAACQDIIEREAVKYFKYLYKKYKQTNYSTAGGVFLNVKMGKKLRELKSVNNFYVHPHAGDGGLALGAALEVYSQKTGKPAFHKMDDSALGDDFSTKEIKDQLAKTKGVVFKTFPNIAKYVARRIAEGAVIGWFQGREEWGPRALGRRSVLADPRKPEAKDRINTYLKKRDWFMPFAPSMMEEKMSRLVKNPVPSPFMAMAFDTTSEGKRKIKAAVHIDSTTRPQSVNKKTNPLYWSVINEFERITGVPAILNTSFNRHGLPIVHSPEDAIDHLLWGAIDELAIGPFIVTRKKKLSS